MNNTNHQKQQQATTIIYSNNGTTNNNSPINDQYQKCKFKKTTFACLIIGMVLYMIYTMMDMNLYTITMNTYTLSNSSSNVNHHYRYQRDIMVNRNRTSFPIRTAQMGWNQVQIILDHLPMHGNILIWGLGYDSIFWNNVTTGRVIFLEDGDIETNLITIPNTNRTIRWFDYITEQHPQLEAYAINYTTKNSAVQFNFYKHHPKKWEKMLAIHNLPTIVYETKWDVILIDAPLGYKHMGPGRFQSIYMSRILVERSIQFLQQRDSSYVHSTPTNDTIHDVVHVFVDDYDRPIEKDFSRIVYEREPIGVEIRTNNPNEQAHFIFYAHPMLDDEMITYSNISLMNSSDIYSGLNAVERASEKAIMYQTYTDDGNITIQQYPTRKRDEYKPLRIEETTEGQPYWLELSHVKQSAFITRNDTSAVVAYNITSFIDESIDQFHTYNETTSRTTDKPIMAIITSSRSSVNGYSTTYDSLLHRHLIQSIDRTVSEVERQHWIIHLYVAVDDTDMYWLNHWEELDIPSWLLFSMMVFPDRGSHIPFNEIALAAYHDGADYFCRVNDDTEFLTNEWITTGVTILQNYDPPNIGVVGPLCNEGNVFIMTHDMVHRTHLEIFHGYYYPPSFGNWFLDDWITNVYSSTNLGPNFSRSTVSHDWIVKHWLYSTRYSPDHSVIEWLPFEYDRGRRLIQQYIHTNFPSHVANTWVTNPITPPSNTGIELVNKVLQVLPPNGNLLIWGFSVLDARYWHRLTSGRVVFLEDPYKGHDDETNKYPYIEYYPVTYTQTREYFQKMINETNLYKTNWYQTNDTNPWCEFKIINFPDTIQATFWDVFLIDSCTKGSDTCIEYDKPGIFQMLFMTKQLLINQMMNQSDIERTGHLFVDDYERPTELEFANYVLMTEPNDIMILPSNDNTTKHIAHYIVHEDDSIMKDEKTLVSC